MSSASKELDREIVADRPDVTDPSFGLASSPEQACGTITQRSPGASVPASKSRSRLSSWSGSGRWDTSDEGVRMTHLRRCAPVLAGFVLVAACGPDLPLPSRLGRQPGREDPAGNRTARQRVRQTWRRPRGVHRQSRARGHRCGDAPACTWRGEGHRVCGGVEVERPARRARRPSP